MARIVAISTSPRKSSTKQPYDAVYVLTQDDTVWRLDIKPGTERELEWTKLPDLPPSEVTAVPRSENEMHRTTTD